MIYMISNTNYLSISQSNKGGERRDKKNMKKREIIFLVYCVTLTYLRHGRVVQKMTTMKKLIERSSKDQSHSHNHARD